MTHPNYSPGDIVKLKNGKIRVILGYEYYPFVGFKYSPTGIFQSVFREDEIQTKVGHDESVYNID